METKFSTECLWEETAEITILEIQRLYILKILSKLCETPD